MATKIASIEAAGGGSNVVNIDVIAGNATVSYFNADGEPQSLSGNSAYTNITALGGIVYINKGNTSPAMEGDYTWHTPYSGIYFLVFHSDGGTLYCMGGGGAN